MQLSDDKGGEVEVGTFLSAVTGIALAALTIWAVYFSIMVIVFVARAVGAWPF